MKMLFSSSDLSEVKSVKNLLLRADIPCQIINEVTSPATVHLALYPELWLEQEEDFLAASVLLASWRRQSPARYARPSGSVAPLNVVRLHPLN